MKPVTPTVPFTVTVVANLTLTEVAAIAFTTPDVYALTLARNVRNPPTEKTQTPTTVVFTTIVVTTSGRWPYTAYQFCESGLASNDTVPAQVPVS